MWIDNKKKKKKNSQFLYRFKAVYKIINDVFGADSCPINQ